VHVAVNPPRPQTGDSVLLIHGQDDVPDGQVCRVLSPMKPTPRTSMLTVSRALCFAGPASSFGASKTTSSRLTVIPRSSHGSFHSVGLAPGARPSRFDPSRKGNVPDGRSH